MINRIDSSEFDTKAKDWDSLPRRVALAQAVADAIRKEIRLRDNMRAFEYGCGTGLVGFALQPYLGHITLADSSEGMLAVLKDKIDASYITNMTAIKIDLDFDPLPVARFDLLYTSMVLHHVADTQKMLQRFYALLTPGGHVSIADLDKEDGTFHEPGFQGHHGFDRNDMKKQLMDAGFQNVRVITCTHTTKETINGMKTFSVFLATGEK